MNSGPFSSDDMLSTLNKRAFNLNHLAIVKGVSQHTAQVIDPLNGINLR